MLFFHKCMYSDIAVCQLDNSCLYIIYLIEWLGGKVFHKRKVYAVAQCFEASVWPTFPNNNNLPYAYKEQLLETTQQHFAFSFKMGRSNFYKFLTRAISTDSCNRIWEVIIHQGSQREPTHRNKHFTQLLPSRALFSIGIFNKARSQMLASLRRKSFEVAEYAAR